MAFDDIVRQPKMLLMMLCIYSLTNGSEQQRIDDKFILDKLNAYFFKEHAYFILYYKPTLLTLSRIS